MNYFNNNKNWEYDWYWKGKLDHNKRLEIFKDNYNFYLEEKELTELLGRKSPWQWNITNLAYLRSNYTTFLSKMKYFVKNLTSLEEEAVPLLLWWNISRITHKIALAKTEEEQKVSNYLFEEALYNNLKYSLYKVANSKEIKDIINWEFFLFDTETTGFTKLSQIIEFWGILYNRKALKSRMPEVRAYWLKNRKSVLFLFNYLTDTVIQETTAYKEIKQISLSEDLSKQDKQDKILELIKNYEPNSKITEEVVREIDDFNFTYNRSVHFYIKPYKDVSNDQVQAVHWISLDKTIEQWLEVKEVIKALKKFLEGKIVIWHNVDFDIKKLAEMFNDFDEEMPKFNKIIDSINIFQVLNKELWISSKVNKYNLDYITKLFLWVSDNEAEDRHTAIYDVKLTYQNILKAIKELDNKTDLSIQLLLQNISKEDKKLLKSLIEKEKEKEGIALN